MSNSPILDIPYIAESQDQKEATANQQTDAQEQASNQVLDLIGSPGTIELSVAQFTRNVCVRVTGSLAGSPNNLTLLVPDRDRAFSVLNATTGGVITVSNGNGTTTVLAAGEAKSLQSVEGLGIMVVGGGSASSGDVVGPSVATDNALARFDTTTGKRLQNSSVVADDDGSLYGNGSKVVRITGNLTLDNSHKGKTILSDSNGAHDITVPLLTSLDANFYCSIVAHGATKPRLVTSGSDVLDCESKAYVRRAAQLIVLFQSQTGSPSGGIVGLYGDLQA